MSQGNMEFSEFNLSKNVLRALKDAGYQTATPIQEQTIPDIMNGRDLIGQSQTGTGKTAAFCLPIIQKINKKDRNVQAIIICPTRELALQITGELRKYTKYEESVKCMAVYGGEPISYQIRTLKQGVKIVVGTPGRMMDHMRRKTLKLGHVSTVVLDEADEMLNMGFEEDIRTILDGVPEERQTLLFSATMNPRILGIAERYLSDPVKVKTQAAELTVDKIKQSSIEVKQSEKDQKVIEILDTEKPKKTVIFCNTKRRVDALVDTLVKKGFRAEGLHGDIEQKMRQKIMNRFKNGGFQILVATDVAARGIDIDNLELVINYDIPQEEEYYVHRIGRTGRNGKAGHAITLYSPKERSQLYNIEHYAKTSITSLNAPREKQAAESYESVADRIQSVIELGKQDSASEQMLNQLLEKHDAVEISKALLQMVMQQEPKRASVLLKSSQRGTAKRSSGKGGSKNRPPVSINEQLMEPAPLVRRGGYSKLSYASMDNMKHRNRKG